MTQSIMAILMSLLLSVSGIAGDISVDEQQVKNAYIKQKSHSATGYVDATKVVEASQDNKQAEQNIQTVVNGQTEQSNQGDVVEDNSNDAGKAPANAQPQKKKQPVENELPIGYIGHDSRPWYVEGEVLFLAETDEEAKAIAESYGMDLKSFSYGVGLLDTGNMTAPEAVSYGKENGLHDVELNHIIYLDDPIERIGGIYPEPIQIGELNSADSKQTE